MITLSRHGATFTQRTKVSLELDGVSWWDVQEDLTKLFGRHGSLSRVLLPPSRSIGLVDFLEPSEAR
jgi:multiple RNA-binding domain-containing protein 1